MNSEEEIDIERLMLTGIEETPDGRPIHKKASDTFVEFMNVTMENPYTFCVDRGLGERYVMRVRSFQSKLRTTLRNRGRKPKQYKVMVDKIETFDTYDEVTIRRTLNQTMAYAKGIAELLGVISEEAEKK